MQHIFSLHLGINIQGVGRRKSIHKATDQSLKFHDTQSSEIADSVFKACRQSVGFLALTYICISK